MEIKDFNVNSFTKFDTDWAIVMAGVEGDFNGMTISWGGLGTLWGQPVFFLFVKPCRYTCEFVQRHKEITVNFFDEKYREAMNIYGTKSGRDIDKEKESGLTPVFEEDGVRFKEAKETLVCEKIYSQQLSKELLPEFAQKFYSHNGETEPHYFVVAKVNRIIE